MKIECDVDLFYEGEEITYSLSSLYDIEKDEYDMTSLAFVQNRGEMGEKYSAIWDREEYLVETLYKKVLIPWVGDRKIEEGEEFSQLLKIQGVNIKDLEGLLELIEQGIKMRLLKEKYE